MKGERAAQPWVEADETGLRTEPRRLTQCWAELAWIAVIERILRLFRSPTLSVRVRAAKLLLDHADLSLPILLEILDDLWDKGLGAKVKRTLLRRSDSGLLAEMTVRLAFPAPFVREVACAVLGQRGGTSETPGLIAALRDPSPWVQREAGFALAHLKDPASADPLLKRYGEAKSEDINVRLALECALQALGVEFSRHGE